MYSQSLTEIPTLIDEIFIAGMSNIELEVLKHSSSFEKQKTKPEILFTLTSSQSNLKNSIDFAFPNGLEISLFPEKPKIYAIVLTNEKGTRSYLYVLLMYDKVKLNDDELRVEISKTSITSTSSLSKSFYVPVAICILSHVQKIEFFRAVLTEIYNIIDFDLSAISRGTSTSNSTLSDDANGNPTIVSYQKIELITCFNFLIDLIKPPAASSFTLNLRFSQANVTFQSRRDIPTKDYCINILFNLLDIGTIIKLFVSLLFEKHVIIIANQNMTLFCICEALISLIFPFKWLHSYIPNLPMDQLDYLESPTPYLMGLLSSFADANELSRLYPSHIICDACSSLIYGNVKGGLPLNEEMKIRRKLILLKNKMNNNYDDVYEERNSVDNECEDVSAKKTFGENVQLIFFRIFRNSLRDIKEKYISNNVFNTQKFLHGFEDDEYKMFFEKLSNTLAFEYFVLSFQYLDDSLSRRFNIVCNPNKKKTSSSMYSYELSIPNQIDELNEEENNDNDLSQMIKSYNETVLLLSSDSTRIKPQIQSQQLHFYQKNGFISFISKYKSKKDLCNIGQKTYSNDNSTQYFYLMAIDSYLRNQTSNKEALTYMIKSFERNRNEFMRNSLYMILNKFTYNDLKNITSSHKFITKSVMFFLRKIEKVKYKTMVIAVDSDDSSGGEDEESDYDVQTNFRIKRLMTTANIKTKPTIIDRKKKSVKISLCNIDDEDFALISSSRTKRAKKNDSIDKDPIALSEMICVKLYDFIIKEKIDISVINTNFLRDIAKNDTFSEIKNLIITLGKVSLLKISQNINCYYCFWLNLFNFLTIFSIIYKGEILTNYYEWYRFLKNSYFLIGGIEISLYEIENMILRKNEISKRIYGEVLTNNIKGLPKLDYFNDLINFGISLPNLSVPIPRIFFPSGFINNLKVNAMEFISRTIKIDFEKLIVTLPEYLLWLDKDFIGNIKNYDNILPKEIVEFIVEKKKDIKQDFDKYDWKMSFANIKNVQSI